MVSGVEEIQASDVGSADELNLGGEAEAPQEVVVEKEEVPDIEMGKTPPELRKKFISLYRALESVADKVVHSPGSRRYHFRPLSAVLFYGKTPVLDCATSIKGKKQVRERFKLTTTGLIDSEGASVSQKAVIDKIKAFKKARGK